ncbi:DUF2007 domain-containing protein [Marinilabiliaceae bacterium JC017]|nr:DUF2007 domain-containing protein [Marinilabiliaceae bacterium JC017]
MTGENNLVNIYSGSEISVVLLKGVLEENDIAAIIQNDYQSGITAGFFGGTPTAIDLFIQESDLKQAEPIINKFLETNHK